MEFVPPCSPIMFDSFGSNSFDDRFDDITPATFRFDSTPATVCFFHDVPNNDGVFTTDALYRTVCQLYKRLHDICTTIPEKDIPFDGDYSDVVKSSFDILQKDDAVPVDQIDRLVAYYTVRPTEFIGYFSKNLYFYFGCDVGNCNADNESDLEDCDAAGYDSW
jgi:hypothetical protein